MIQEPDYLVRPSFTRQRRPFGRKAGLMTHGTRSSYNAGCGCGDCLRAERLYSRRRWRWKPPPRMEWRREWVVREQDAWTNREDLIEGFRAKRRKGASDE